MADCEKTVDEMLSSWEKRMQERKLKEAEEAKKELERKATEMARSGGGRAS